MTQDPCLLCTDVQTKLKNYYQINYVFDQNWCFFSSNQLYFCYRSTDKSPILHQSCIRNYNKGDNPIVDVLIENAEEYDEQFLRGVLVGITYCLAVERTFSTPFVKKAHHDRIIPMFDSTRQYILERASSL